MSHDAPPPDHSGEAITILKVEPRQDGGVVVTLPTAAAEGRLDDRHSAYHDNISPPVVWDPVPGAVAYALVVEDPDAPREHPFVHWMIWNIPGSSRGLPERLPAEPRPATPKDAVQGRNDNREHGWFGPRPPEGHGVHRYYFQVFALDQALEMGPDTPLSELLNALKGHTLAKGEAVATYEQPEQL